MGSSAGKDVVGISESAVARVLPSVVNRGVRVGTKVVVGVVGSGVLASVVAGGRVVVCEATVLG